MVVSYLKAVLSLDNRKFKKGLDDSKKETAKFGKQIGRVGTAIGTAFAVKALADFVRGMDRLYAKTQNVTSGFQDIQDAFFEIAKAGQYGRGINIAFKRIADDIRVAGGEARKYAYLLEYSNDELADYIKLLQSDIMARGYLDHTRTVEELNAALKITNDRAESYKRTLDDIRKAGESWASGFPDQIQGPWAPGVTPFNWPRVKKEIDDAAKALDEYRRKQVEAVLFWETTDFAAPVTDEGSTEANPFAGALLGAGIGGDTIGAAIQQYSELAMKIGLVSVAATDMTSAITAANEKLITMGEIMQNLLAAAFQSFTRMVMDIVTGGDILSAFGTFLQDLGNMMAQYGAALIAFGIAENAFLSGDAYTKIAAGAVMLAAGLALGVIGGQINKTGGAGISGGTGSYGGGYAGGYGYGGPYDYNREIVLVARGEDLVATINRQNYIDGING